jgi:ferric-dicitrate binding protein FerR (iron transport regulator)
MEPDRDACLERWRDGLAGPAELAELLRREGVERLRDELRFQALLSLGHPARAERCLARVRALLDRKHPDVRLRLLDRVHRRLTRRRLWRRLIAPAAAALLALGVCWFALRSRADAPAVWRETAAGRIPLRPGATVRAEGRDEAVVLADGSRLVLAPGSRLDVGTDAGRFHLAGGRLQVLAAPRGRDRLVVATPTADAAVTGTRFTLIAGEEAAWLAVDEGSVRFANAAGGLDVQAGRRALAAKAVPPSTPPAPDPRPIGSWVLCYGSTPGNPRGWFGAAEEDFRGPAGRDRFRARALQAVDKVVAALRRHDAQGVILWDVEGNTDRIARFPGDPRLVAELAPEMDAAADELFSRLAAAGFATGVRVCVHPHRRAGDGRFTTVADDGQALAEAAARIGYARRRWGCRLFFLGHNLNAAGLARVAAGQTVDPELHATPAGLLLALQARFPDCLVIPEYAGIDAWALTPCFVRPDASGLARARAMRDRWPWAVPAFYRPAEGRMQDGITLVEIDPTR